MTAAVLYVALVAAFVGGVVVGESMARAPIEPEPEPEPRRYPVDTRHVDIMTHGGTAIRLYSTTVSDSGRMVPK